MFSCTTNALAVKGRRPRPPCVGGGQAREMTLASVAPGTTKGVLRRRTRDRRPRRGVHQLVPRAAGDAARTRASRGRVRGLTWRKRRKPRSDSSLVPTAYAVLFRIYGA
jgi:hypothetical protein